MSSLFERFVDNFFVRTDNKNLTYVLKEIFKEDSVIKIEPKDQSLLNQNKRQYDESELLNFLTRGNFHTLGAVLIMGKVLKPFEAFSSQRNLIKTMNEHADNCKICKEHRDNLLNYHNKDKKTKTIINKEIDDGLLKEDTKKSKRK